MTLTVEFQNRDSTERTVWPWQSVEVVRFTKAAIGGPRKALIRAYGSPLDLWEFMEMLRCPVIITHKERAKAVWWGYINEVTVFAEGEHRTASLNGMANNISVGYTLNQFAFKTAYSSNSASTSEYGTKDLILTARDRTDTQAQNYRDTELERRKYPIITRPEHSSIKRMSYAEIECYGWWETLGWRYYSQDQGQEAYEDIDNYQGREIGEDDRPKCAQSFQISSAAGWDAYEIYIRIRKYGSPTDDVIVRLKDDDGGDPAAADLATSTVAHGSIESYMDWVEFTLSSAVSLSTGTDYWISVEMDGVIDIDNCYMVDGNAQRGYTSGLFKLYRTSGGTWYEKTTMDMNFRVIGRSETTAQIDALENSVGEFIVDCTVTDDSGVYTPEYRDGDNTAKFEAEELLDIGTSNNLRLLARILENRWMEVYEEPPQFEADYSMDAKGVITDQFGAIVHPSDCPTAVWMKFESSIPSSTDTSKLMNADYLFVEEAEYMPRENKYRVIRTRDTDIYRDLFGVGYG